MVVVDGAVRLRGSGCINGEDCVTPTLFVLWGQGRIARLEAECGAMLEDTGTGRFLAEIGWDTPAGVRRWHRWRREVKFVRLADIEDALTPTGYLLSDLYPNTAEEVGAP